MGNIGKKRLLAKCQVRLNTLGVGAVFRYNGHEYRIEEIKENGNRKVWSLEQKSIRTLSGNLVIFTWDVQ